MQWHLALRLFCAFLYTALSSHCQIITAIVPTCNRFEPLNDAVHSVLNQTVTIHEVIVVVSDGHKCMHNVGNPWGNRVRILHMEGCKKNICGTAGRARQYGIERADPNTTHFAFLDDDDVWLPNKTNMQLEAMKRENLSVVSSDAFVTEGLRGRCSENGKYQSWNLTNLASLSLKRLNGEKCASQVLHKFGGKLPTRVTFHEISRHNIFVQSATMMEKHALMGGYDLDATNGNEDYGLAKKVLKKFPAVYLLDATVIYDDNKSFRGCIRHSDTPTNRKLLTIQN